MAGCVACEMLLNRQCCVWPNGRMANLVKCSIYVYLSLFMVEICEYLFPHAGGQGWNGDKVPGCESQRDTKMKKQLLRVCRKCVAAQPTCGGSISWVCDRHSQSGRCPVQAVFPGAHGTELTARLCTSRKDISKGGHLCLLHMCVCLCTHILTYIFFHIHEKQSIT